MQMRENVLLKLYSNVMENYTTKSPFNYAKNVQIQGHLKRENCLLLNPLKWVLSMEHFGLWLNECLTRLETDLNRGFF